MSREEAKPADTIRGKHEPDPSNCLRCWEQENDEVYRIAREIHMSPQHIDTIEHFKE